VSPIEYIRGALQHRPGKAGAQVRLVLAVSLAVAVLSLGVRELAHALGDNGIESALKTFYGSQYSVVTATGEIGQGNPTYIIPVSHQSQATFVSRGSGINAVASLTGLYYQTCSGPATRLVNLVNLNLVTRNSTSVVEGSQSSIMLSRDASTVVYVRGLHLEFASLPTGAVISKASMPGAEFHLKALSPSGASAAVAMGRDTSELWLSHIAGTSSFVASVEAPIRSVAWLGEDELLLEVHQGQWRKVNLTTGDSSTWRQPANNILRAFPSPDGLLVAMLATDPERWIISGVDGEVLHTLPIGATFLDWSPTGAQYAASIPVGPIAWYTNPNTGVSWTTGPKRLVRVFARDGRIESDGAEIPSGEPLGSFSWALNDALVASSASCSN
jgi:hypothetical protein